MTPYQSGYTTGTLQILAGGLSGDDLFLADEDARGLHARRTPSGHCNHWDPGGIAAAGGSDGARRRAASQMPKQYEEYRAGFTELPFCE